MRNTRLLCLASGLVVMTNVRGGTPVTPPTEEFLRDSLYLNEVVVTGQGGALQRRRLSAQIEKV